MRGLLQITLDEASTNLIREQISHLYLPKQEYHVSLAFNLNELPYRDLIGQKVQFNSTRVLSDNKIQALFIALPSNTNWPPKSNHHITLSHTLGTPPKLSNQLPEYHTESKPVKLTLSGIVEFKSFS